MADTVREIERKYEAGDSAGEARLPDLSRVAGVATVADQGPAELDAVYYDTADRRLAAAGITLRRRTGGSDAGWHLKLPVAPGTRDEIRAPLSPGVPRALAALVRARTRDAELVPLVRIVSRREVHLLLDEHGGVLAEASADAVTAARLADGGRTVHWTEFELELGKDTDPDFLDVVEPHLREAGLRTSKAPSKLSRALAETDPEPPVKRKPRPAEPGRPTAGDHVLAYVRAQAEAVVAGDLDVRRDVDDSVHQMRVATRRLRSAFRTFGKVLDREVTDPIGAELKWLAGELGVDRDREVLSARLRERVDEVPDTLVLGPVRARLRRWAAGRHAGARKRLLSVLDSERHLALLDTLDALLADPPLLPAAADPARGVIAEAVLRDYRRLARRVDHALATEAGPGLDTALHEARKAAKRARYAAEAAQPALGKPVKRFARRMKSVQSLLGEHQDSVMAREALRALAVQAHAAGESTYTLGLLHGREEALAAGYERELPGLWEKASAKRHRAALRG
ncbi:CYTH and CHAD domain-containing protein [Streptomyces netropsis]|uniref:CHAD domain-containing protein n=1 Tax=Streptomyces netropsis TaxID=55404 RepID=A0A7W7PC60_STRNE|nr:CYTH and CHAD domain-containing protein [Streptomyces netropsis]MBB4884282.1 CHAD domain-containing protein [Streptomyces netropsis]GGR04772.1 CHAD domain-containing protein [Streptomyces netropsis]